MTASLGTQKVFSIINLITPCSFLWAQITKSHTTDTRSSEMDSVPSDIVHDYRYFKFSYDSLSFNGSVHSHGYPEVHSYGCGH